MERRRRRKNGKRKKEGKGRRKETAATPAATGTAAVPAARRTVVGFWWRVSGTVGERQHALIASEFSDLASLGIHDFDAYVEHLEDELHKLEVENTHVANEIELLAKTHKDGITEDS